MSGGGKEGRSGIGLMQDVYWSRLKISNGKEQGT